MDQDTMHKVAITIIAKKYLDRKTTGNPIPPGIPPFTTGSEALEMVKDAAKKDLFGTLCGKGNIDMSKLVKIPEENYGSVNSLENRAKLLGVPLNEYLDFCEEIVKQLKQG